MPYQTPSASQYTMIKRLQTDISGRAAQGQYKFRAPPLTYGGYFAGLANINALPVNALLSNKFIQPEVPAGPWVIDLDADGFHNLSGITPPNPVSKIIINVTNNTTLTDIGVNFSSSVGYTFPGTACIVSPSDACNIQVRNSSTDIYCAMATLDAYQLTITLTSNNFVGPIDVGTV